MNRASEISASPKLLDSAADDLAEARTHPQDLSHSEETIEARRFFRGLAIAFPVSILMWVLLIGAFFALS